MIWANEKNKNPKLFKGKYHIVFYDKNDEWEVAFFNNIKEICIFKNLEVNSKNYNLIKVELYRALKRPDNYTRMLNGTSMHVRIIDLIKKEEDE